MLDWLKSLFRPKAAQPSAQPEAIYRFTKERSHKTAAKGKTLFSAPNPVQVVPPTKEADEYKWIDYDGTFRPDQIEAKVPAPRPTNDPTIPAEGTESMGNPSGVGRISGMRTAFTGCCTMVTGYAYRVITGRAYQPCNRAYWTDDRDTR